MRRDEDTVQKTLDRFLDRFGAPPKEKMEAAGERVLAQLKSHSTHASEDTLPEFTAVRPSLKRRAFAVAAAAAAVILAIVLPMRLLRSRLATNPDAPAVLESADGRRNVGYGELVLSDDKAGKSGAVLTLADRSRVEMRSQSELVLERADDGVRIRLGKGSVIVTAVKQRVGHLYVQTKDVTVSVVGTVFLVNAEEEGSRVAVIQGEVRVQQGATLKKLLPGEQVASNPIMQSVPVIQEIQWSRYAMAHLALLQQAIVVPPPQPPSRPEFEVASIRACSDSGGGARGGRSGGVGGTIQRSPGRLLLGCTTVEGLIRQAYLTFANGRRNFQPFRNFTFEGAPPWISSERYTIDAKADASVSPEMMNGPMLQALLEDRFKLALHRETREVSVYALTVARNGFKLKEAEDGSCGPPSLNPARPARVDSNGKVEFLDGGDQRMPCGSVGIFPKGVQLFGGNFNDFAKLLGSGLDRPVIDRTGIAGMFDFRLEFDHSSAQFLPAVPRLSTDSTTATAPTDLSPSLFTALQEQLGLKLDPSRGLVEFYVIDRVDRPTEN